MNQWTSKTKAVMYCRVSSKEQESGYSLDAQEKLLTEYATKNNLKIAIKPYRISESASGKHIRKTFNEMLRYATKNRIPIILCEKIDRLTRNLKDASSVSEWLAKDEKREVNFVKENFVVNKNTRAHENLVWDMKVAIARFYTNNLSEEVIKAHKIKLSLGQLPTTPPFGYKPLGETGKKVHEIDDKVALYLRKMFDWYATGNYSIARLVSELHQIGLRTKSGKKVGKSCIHRYLSEPFYYGKIRWKGKIYPAVHEPMISKELFDKVQTLLKRKTLAPHYRIHNPLFKSKIHCEHCGGLVTWYIQKGHWYGHCNNHGESRKCPQKTCIRQDRIEKQLFPYFDEIAPQNKEVLGWIENIIREENGRQVQEREKKILGLTASLEQIRKRKDQIYEDKIDEKIPIEFYERKFAEYSQEEEALEDALEKASDNSDVYQQLLLAIHELAYKVNEIYENAEVDEKRLLLSHLFTNILQNRYEIKPHYTLVAEYLAYWVPRLNSDYELPKNLTLKGNKGASAPTSPIMRAWRDSLRTMKWQNVFPDPTVSLEQIKELLALT